MNTLKPEQAERFLSKNPTLLKMITNDLGQHLEFFEHPTQGDEAPVYVKIDGFVANTGFWDLGDIYAGSEYMPELHGEKIDCQFTFKGKSNG